MEHGKRHSEFQFFTEAISIGENEGEGEGEGERRFSISAE